MAARTSLHAASATGWRRLQPRTPASRPAASSRPTSPTMPALLLQVPEAEVCGAGVLSGRRQPSARLVRPAGSARTPQPPPAPARPWGGRPRTPPGRAGSARAAWRGRGRSQGPGGGGNGGLLLFLFSCSPVPCFETSAGRSGPYRGLVCWRVRRNMYWVRGAAGVFFSGTAWSGGLPCHARVRGSPGSSPGLVSCLQSCYVCLLG